MTDTIEKTEAEKTTVESINVISVAMITFVARVLEMIADGNVSRENAAAVATNVAEGLLTLPTDAVFRDKIAGHFSLVGKCIKTNSSDPIIEHLLEI